MKLIVGLGNPGAQYANTRHNIGFNVIEHISDKWGVPLNKQKFEAQYGEGFVNGEKVILVKPLTFMNLSGRSVAEFINYYDVDREDFVVIHDDIDSPVGRIRLRQKGSSGGQNGIKSLIKHFGNIQEFNRIKVGVGRPTNGRAVVDHVLGRFEKEEVVFMEATIVNAANAIECWMQNDFIKAANDYNSK